MSGGVLEQIEIYLANDIINPPDAHGRRKLIILYAPGYNKAPAASIQDAGGYVVKSCEQLHKQIRQLGGS